MTDHFSAFFELFYVLWWFADQKTSWELHNSARLTENRRSFESLIGSASVGTFRMRMQFWVLKRFLQSNHWNCFDFFFTTAQISHCITFSNFECFTFNQFHSLMTWYCLASISASLFISNDQLLPKTSIKSTKFLWMLKIVKTFLANLQSH